MRCKQWQTAVRALQQVLALSAGQRVDLTVVAALVGQVEAGRGGGGDAQQQAAEGEQQQQQQQQQGSDAALAAEGVMPAGAPAEPAAADAADGSDSLADLAAALGQLGASEAAAGSGGAEDAAAQAEAVAKAAARAQEVLEQSVGQLLKGIAATASGDSAFWELYARQASQPVLRPALPAWLLVWGFFTFLSSLPSCRLHRLLRLRPPHAACTWLPARRRPLTKCLAPSRRAFVGAASPAGAHL